MNGDVNYFRNRFMGGFNKKDVINYITMMAKERNELTEAKNKAVSDARSLAAEVASLRRELEEMSRLVREDNKQKAAVFAAASDVFSEFETAFIDLRSEIEEATIDVSEELKKTCDTVAKLPAVLVEAGERLEELRAAFNAEKETVRIAAAQEAYETEGITEEDVQLFDAGTGPDDTDVPEAHNPDSGENGESYGSADSVA